MVLETKSWGRFFGSPNSFLIKAIKNNWHPYRWNDNWIENPIFKSEGMKWWDEAEVHWRRDNRNYLVVDIQETIIGTKATIFFRSGKSIELRKVSRMSWEELLEYAEGNYRK